MLKTLLKFSAQSFIIFAVILVAGGFGHFFIVEPTEVEGRSMESFLYDNDIIVIEKVSLLLSRPKRGQIISVLDEDNKILLVKRIIGLPGEAITIKDGKTFITNDKGVEWQLDEEYLTDGTNTYSAGEQDSFQYPVLSENEYFVMGDNREHSTDSRAYGPIHRNNIVGVVNKLLFTNR